MKEDEMRRFAMMFCALTSPCLAGADGETPRTALKGLSGTWVVVGCEARGKKITNDELPWQWTFTADGKATLTDRKKGDASHYTYTIDPSRQPRTIDLTYRGPSPALKNTRQLGIYRMEDDRLTICLGSPGGVEKDRPGEFDTRAEGSFLMRLERARGE
jgi:uncharacterized protein (TIGR03067 family)